MLFVIEWLLLCLVFWGLCILGTGTDAKNLKNLSSYPERVQQQIKANPAFAAHISPSSPLRTFGLNLLLYTPLFLILCSFLRTDSFFGNFLTVFLMGELLNCFDLLVIDLLWWRHTPRIRFSGTEHRPELYQDPKTHIHSFVRGALLFLVVALLDGMLLTWF